MSQYSKLVDIITKPPEERSDFEIGAILPYFLKRTTAFQRIQRADLLKDLIKHCEFGSKERDDIIIKQGDVGECFYVLLSGQVSVYIHNQDKGEEEEKLELQSIVQYKDGKLDRTRLGQYVISLGEGSSVGEVALIEEHKPIRTATVVVDTKTDLLVVDKPLYERSVRSILAQEFQDKRQFIQNNALFRGWTAKYCKQLTMALYKRTLPYDSLLVKQGDEVDCVYFILRGTVEIQIDASAHPTQYAKIFRAANENEAEKLVRKSDKGRSSADTNTGGGGNNSSSSSNLRKRDSSRSTRLCYLGINEAVGDTEMTMDLDSYLQTAVCQEHTEVLVLERKHYERLFVRRHPRTIDAMRRQIGIKLRTRQAHLSPRDDVPLLGHVATLIEARAHPPAQQPLSVERERVEVSVSEAEREFLNHKGPLIDQHGPGSVFYLIKMREQTKLKLRSKRERVVERPQAMKNLPSSVILAAHQLIHGSHEPLERAQSARGRERALPAQPRSFRRIQSAVQDDADDVEGKECAFQARESQHRGRSARAAHHHHHHNDLDDENNNNDDDFDVVDDNNDDDDEDRSEPSGRAWMSGSPRLLGGGAGSGGGGGGLRGGGGDEVLEDPQQHDARLSFLEEKIRQWLRKDNPRGGPQVTQLRRLTAQDMGQQPRPGNKVVIRRRRRAPSSSDNDNDDSVILNGATPRPKKEDSRTKPFQVLLHTNS